MLCRSSERNTRPQPSPSAEIQLSPVFFLIDKGEVETLGAMTDKAQHPMNYWPGTPLGTDSLGRGDSRSADNPILRGTNQFSVYMLSLWKKYIFQKWKLLGLIQLHWGVALSRDKESSVHAGSGLFYDWVDILWSQMICLELWALGYEPVIKETDCEMSFSDPASMWSRIRSWNTQV